MESDVKSRGEQLVADLDRVRQRFSELADDDGELREGLRIISRGLSTVIEDVDIDAVGDQTRLEVVVRGLRTLADVLSGREDGADAPTDGAEEEVDEATEFREMFRKEAKKRLSGLSISMMGIFSDSGGDGALEQTSDHLHAMKGASAMVGLDQISQLVASMEQVVLEMMRQPPEERTWPTRALLRGFHLLEKAAADPDLEIDGQKSNDVIGALEACRDVARRPDQPSVGLAEETDETELASEDSSDDDTAPWPVPKPGEEESAFDFSDYDGPLEKRILVVDDVDTIAASVGLVLSELDVPIEMASHGEEALEMLGERPYSLVISDVTMPRMDGIALTRMIRSDEYMNEIPVILLTSLDRPDERDAGIEAGASDYIIKGSIGGGELLTRVKELLEIAPDVPAGDFRREGDERRILIAEDVETIAASIAFVLSEGPFEIDIAQNGARALEQLRESSYDLLLSDVQMPEMSGLELLTAVRRDDQLADLPIILLTSLEDPEVQEEALDIGANRFLIKGKVGGNRLREIVEEVADKGH